MNYAEAEKKLKACGQEHLVAGWSKLSKKGREALLAQVEAIDPKEVARCQAELKSAAAPKDGAKPLTRGPAARAPKVATLKGAALAKAVAVGERELKAGRVAALRSRDLCPALGLPDGNRQCELQLRRPEHAA